MKKVMFNCLGGMCLCCEGCGLVIDFDLIAFYDVSKFFNEGAFMIFGYSMDGWYGCIFCGCGYFDLDKLIVKFNKWECNDFFYKELIKIKVDGINFIYEGLILRIEKLMLFKDFDVM